MFWSVTLSLLEGLREVVKLFALTLVFSLPLGLAVTFGSMSKCRPVSWFFNVLVWIVRGTAGAPPAARRRGGGGPLSGARPWFSLGWSRPPLGGPEAPRPRTLPTARATRHDAARATGGLVPPLRAAARSPPHEGGLGFGFRRLRAAGDKRRRKPPPKDYFPNKCCSTPP